MTPNSAPSVTVGAFWTRTPEALCSALACGTQGLETPDAARRLSKYGRNSDAPTKKAGLLRALLGRLLEPLSLIKRDGAFGDIDDERVVPGDVVRVRAQASWWDRASLQKQGT